ncbi:hypothetical protein L7F22_061438 [Adiantum nelumboides]|nr:hypothetical protein [Adiantum nelumboides]
MTYNQLKRVLIVLLKAHLVVLFYFDGLIGSLGMISTCFVKQTDKASIIAAAVKLLSKGNASQKSSKQETITNQIHDLANGQPKKEDEDVQEESSTSSDQWLLPTKKGESLNALSEVFSDLHRACEPDIMGCSTFGIHSCKVHVKSKKGKCTWQRTVQEKVQMQEHSEQDVLVESKNEEDKDEEVEEGEDEGEDDDDKDDDGFSRIGPALAVGADPMKPNNEPPKDKTGKINQRWAESASVTRITAVDVSKFMLDYICSRFGTPLEILSDRGPGFRADLLDALLENLSIKHVHSTPYYPQCNGLVEKTNGVLCKIITKHVRNRPQDWDKHLIAALWAYRTSFKVSTQFTPYHFVYGQESLLPIEVEHGSLRVLARETTSSKEKLEQRILDLQRLELDREAATDYYITQANKKSEEFNNKVKEKKLEEKMLVMRYDSRLDLSHSKKFPQRWEGPYVIFKKFKNESYWLQNLSDKIHKYPVNGWRLKEFFQCIQPIKEKRQVSLDA